jgi:hypothetical protein
LTKEPFSSSCANVDEYGAENNQGNRPLKNKNKNY